MPQRRHDQPTTFPAKSLCRHSKPRFLPTYFGHARGLSTWLEWFDDFPSALFQSRVCHRGTYFPSHLKFHRLVTPALSPPCPPRLRRALQSRRSRWRKWRFGSCGRCAPATLLEPARRLPRHPPPRCLNYDCGACGGIPRYFPCRSPSALRLRCARAQRSGEAESGCLRPAWGGLYPVPDQLSETKDRDRFNRLITQAPVRPSVNIC